MISSIVSAGDIVGGQNSTIKNLGCHKKGTVCYGTLEDAVGPSSCQNTSIRWKVTKDDLNTQLAYSTFLAAHVAGKRVSFYVSDTCFESMPSYPTFNYYSIY